MRLKEVQESVSLNFIFMVQGKAEQNEAMTLRA